MGKRPGDRRLGRWMFPPLHNAASTLRTREKFPGREFAEKGVAWLDASLHSPFPMEKRKQYAKRCFSEAIRLCNIELLVARNRNDPAKAEYLQELIKWLDSYKPKP